MKTSLFRWNYRATLAGVILGGVGYVLNLVAAEYSWALLCAASATVSMVTIFLFEEKKE
jgi:hypothetical protein